MITSRFDKQGLTTKIYIVKISCKGVCGFNYAVQTKLPIIWVHSLIKAHVREGYEVNVSEAIGNKLPSGYYETFTIDNVLSNASRLRFYELETVKEEKVVYVEKLL